MDEIRSDPDALLQQLQKEAEAQGRGSLKIFFGYAAGVGKTYAMLKAAHAAKRRGVDVVAGYIEPHARPQTAQLQNGLERLPARLLHHGGMTLREFDLDAALARRPQLLLVDELAHTNADGSRHCKRYQDIKELLAAGIDVYTTVNVQHIESLNDLVASVTGVTVQERIPDSVFDDASQVELVDLEPRELIERLQEGKVYREAQAERALGNFFTEQNLVALREIALRRCADRVNKMAAQSGCKAAGGQADEHILVCLSASPSNAKIIRTAARMAGAFRGCLTALFVETPDFSSSGEADKRRLRQHIRLAQQLGAAIETVYGDDIAFQISEFARLSGVSKIVLGRSSVRRSPFFGRPSLTERITQLSPNLDIYIIPDQSTPRPPRRRAAGASRLAPADVLKSALILALFTTVGYVFYRLGFSEANIITAYILSVLVTAVVTSRRVYSLVSSLISVLLFNFFFTEPRFSFAAYDAGYPVTFLIMFLAAFLTSSLAVRIQQQARLSAKTAFRTKLLLDANRLLSGENDPAGIINVTCSQLTRLLDKTVLFYRVEEDGSLSTPLLYPVYSGQSAPDYTSENERAVASWVLHNNKHAGATTGTLGDSKCLYLSVRVGNDVFGVVGVAIGDAPLDAFQNSIMLSILGECALALKNDKISKEREAAALLAKNEQLRANLLRSISHDLRTPLTSISGNAGILLASEDSIGKEKRLQLYADIYDESLWLINLVENLLSVTRIEDGTMKLHLTAELLDELMQEALRHTGRRRGDRKLTVRSECPLLLVKADARLIMQVLINLVDNAIKYTPPGSEIVVEAKARGTRAVVSVRDDGGGIPDDAKAHIFDMFYTAESPIADSRRSLGLGLALCKSIVTAHGGTIAVTDNQPHGAVFTFTLPIEEVTLHE